MDTLFIPNETDFRKWIQEAVKAGIDSAVSIKAGEKEEPLISRKQVAGIFGWLGGQPRWVLLLDL